LNDSLLNIYKSEVTRKEVEQLIGKEKTSTSNILNKMVDEKIINKIGNGPGTKYVII
jgi:predicted HTH transcriptional regulator